MKENTGIVHRKYINHKLALKHVMWGYWYLPHTFLFDIKKEGGKIKRIQQEFATNIVRKKIFAPALAAEWSEDSMVEVLSTIEKPNAEKYLTPTEPITLSDTEINELRINGILHSQVCNRDCDKCVLSVCYKE